MGKQLIEVGRHKDRMVVVDGRRTIATARKWGIGVWMLTMKSGCWIDTMTDTDRQAALKRMGFSATMAPHMKVCKTRREALKWMRGLAE